MEITINNAFVIAVKVSCGLFLAKYRKTTRNALFYTYLLIGFFLRKPYITITLCSIFLIVMISALSIGFVVIIGVLFFIIMILLIEGFLIIAFLFIMSMITSNIWLLVIMVYEFRNMIIT